MSSTSTLPPGLNAPGPIYTVDQVNAGSDLIPVNVPNPILMNMGGVFVYCPAGQYQLNVDVAGNSYFAESGGTHIGETIHINPDQATVSPLLFPNIATGEGPGGAIGSLETDALPTVDPPPPLPPWPPTSPGPGTTLETGWVPPWYNRTGVGDETAARTTAAEEVALGNPSGEEGDWRKD
jgi:hypothetical protein